MAKKKPAMLPANMAGAKSPATPPPEVVQATAPLFTTIMASAISISSVGVGCSEAKGEEAVISSQWPESISVTNVYPSP